MIVDSTTKAEEIVASQATKEAIWIKKFITKLGAVPSIIDSLHLYCDNNGHYTSKGTTISSNIQTSAKEVSFD